MAILSTCSICGNIVGKFAICNGIKMRLSIIMPTYNNLQRLKVTLSFLEAQDLPKNKYEVILVNDGSEDGTKEYLHSLCSDIDLLIINQENAGQARARNKGLSLAKSKYVLFMDDDVIAEKVFLRKHYESHEDDNNPKVVVGQINNIPFCNYDNALNLIRNKDENLWSALEGLVQKDAYLNIRNWVWDNGLENLSWLGFTTANASMPRELLLEAGGFDEKFVGWGPEDVELGYRLKMRGLTFAYHREFVNFHLDKAKATNTFYSMLSRNLRYLREEKYPDNIEIWKYIQFIGGQISIEEFNCCCSQGTQNYVKQEGEHYFKFIDYFLHKV